jgi:hypothetical protein
MTGSFSPASQPVVPLDKTLDTKTVEVLALALFRTMFRQGIRVPLKVPDLMDMDLVVRDNNILLNMNKVQIDPPQLLIWHLTFAYQGKPVVEYGRGIKNGMKLHYPQLIFLLMAMWRDKRRKIRENARGAAARTRELVRVSVTDPRTGLLEDTTD